MSRSVQSVQAFLRQYAHKDPQSTVYRGTLFELQTLEALTQIGFRLMRVGGRGDGGIDLRGHWPLANLCIVAQCKHVQRGLSPDHVRSLAGALAMQAPGTLGILAGSKGPFTPDVIAHFNGSPLPLGLALVSEAQLSSVVFNATALDRLGDIAILLRHDGRGNTTPIVTRHGLPLAVTP